MTNEFPNESSWTLCRLDNASPMDDTSLGQCVPCLTNVSQAWANISGGLSQQLLAGTWVSSNTVDCFFLAEPWAYLLSVF